MSNCNRFSDKAIRSKKLEDMNEAELALFKIQAGQAFESLKAKFKDEPNMLMALTSQYEAIGRGAKNATVCEEFSDEDFEGTRLGEIAHNTFQAACRGAVRKSVGLHCPEGVHLYMIFSTNRGTGFPQALLKRIFPGCAIVDWEPVSKELTKLQQMYLDLSKTTGFENMKKKEIAADLWIKAPNLTRLEKEMSGVKRKSRQPRAIVKISRKSALEAIKNYPKSI